MGGEGFCSSGDVGRTSQVRVRVGFEVLSLPGLDVLPVREVGKVVPGVVRVTVAGGRLGPDTVGRF